MFSKRSSELLNSVSEQIKSLFEISNLNLLNLADNWQVISFTSDVISSEKILCCIALLNKIGINAEFAKPVSSANLFGNIYIKESLDQIQNKIDKSKEEKVLLNHDPKEALAERRVLQGVCTNLTEQVSGNAKIHDRIKNIFLNNGWSFSDYRETVDALTMASEADGKQQMPRPRTP